MQFTYSIYSRGTILCVCVCIKSYTFGFIIDGSNDDKTLSPEFAVPVCILTHIDTFHI